jgi:hypothetical protein
MAFCSKAMYMQLMKSLRLCFVHVETPLTRAFEALGHQVLALWPTGGGVLHLPTELAAHGFTPDVVLQQELLGPRLLLTGLEEVPGLRAFWGRDPHLNAFWQAPYARLFDLTFATQPHSLPDLAACGAERLLHLPWYAPDRPFHPFGERGLAASFAGRLGPTRPVRTWLVEQMRALLGESFRLEEDLGFEQMLDLYADSQMVPNESLAGEVNFRLFEAAACGCVVLAQDLGPDQEALFTPGREMLVCADSLELAENIALLQKRPRLAEAMGRAAWERVQADHLPPSRAAAILAALADTLPTAASTADEARRWFMLTLAAMLEAGRIDGVGLGDHGANSNMDSGAHIARELAALPGQDALVLAARLRVGALLEDGSGLPELLNEAVARCRVSPPAHTDDDLRLQLTCAMLALRQAVREPNSGHWLALCREITALTLNMPGDMPNRLAETTPAGLLQAWARRLRASTLPARGGFPFEPGLHLPATASECLHWAVQLAHGDVDVLRELKQQLEATLGSDSLLLGTLSELGLRLRQDWRICLETALCNLRVFRTAAGLSELSLGLSLANEQGQGAAFHAALAAADPSGRISRALA